MCTQRNFGYSIVYTTVYILVSTNCGYMLLIHNCVHTTCPQKTLGTHCVYTRVYILCFFKGTFGTQCIYTTVEILCFSKRTLSTQGIYTTVDILCVHKGTLFTQCLYTTEYNRQVPGSHFRGAWPVGYLGPITGVSSQPPHSHRKRKKEKWGEEGENMIKQM